MRVDLRTYGLGPPEEKNTERATTSRVTDELSDKPASLDKARFSFDQARVKALEDQVLAQPEARQQKVELLRQAMGKGEYAVNEGQIADAMIADLAAGVSRQYTG
ncbi:MAG TPA: flagellar biosynthesis anti-sigma factor FlgM [Terriglobales bacterium]|nr:flagellar biosynthesis anti-sigma factor FlgM [Terriglobales bacterium]